VEGVGEMVVMLGDGSGLRFQMAIFDGELDGGCRKGEVELVIRFRWCVSFDRSD
jgi:hypothetical protein